jgi:hypothetical protein
MCSDHSSLLQLQLALMPKRDASTSRRPIDAAKFELPASATRAAASIR